MNSVERFQRALNHQEPDRVPIHDHPWPSTVDRWRQEGLPASVSPDDYFGFEMARIRPDLSPRLPAEIIEEDAEHILERTPYGSLRQQRRDRASIPEIVEWGIHSRADWEKIKPLLQPHSSRVGEQVWNDYKDARQKGRFAVFHAHIGFAHFQEYIKNDQLLMLMVTDPEWIKDMFQTQAQFVVGLADMMMNEGMQFDGAFINCDLGYRNASLFSPQMYRNLQFPYDRQVFRFFRDRGIPVIFHSDGCVKALIPQFIEAGISCLQPIEVKAGMDLIELKREYGRDLAFMGGIDVRAMADPDPLVIEYEIRRKFEVAMKDGGYIFHSDHSVPHDVSLAQYTHVIELVQKYGVY